MDFPLKDQNADIHDIFLNIPPDTIEYDAFEYYRKSRIPAAEADVHGHNIRAVSLLQKKYFYGRRRILALEAMITIDNILAASLLQTRRLRLSTHSCCRSR